MLVTELARLKNAQTKRMSREEMIILFINIITNNITMNNIITK